MAVQYVTIKVKSTAIVPGGIMYDKLKDSMPRAIGNIKILNNIFDVGDSITINGVTIVLGTAWKQGATISDSCRNIAIAIKERCNQMGVIPVAVLASEAPIMEQPFTDTIYLKAIVQGPDGEVAVSVVDGATTNFAVSPMAGSTNYNVKLPVTFSGHNKQYMAGGPFLIVDLKLGCQIECKEFQYLDTESKKTPLADYIDRDILQVFDQTNTELTSKQIFTYTAP